MTMLFFWLQDRPRISVHILDNIVEKIVQAVAESLYDPLLIVVYVYLEY
jgi:hypothetical protein